LQCFYKVVICTHQHRERHLPMGRSVSTPNNTVAKAIVDTMHHGYEWDDENQCYDYDSDFDHDLCDIQWDDFTYDVIERAKAKWPTLEDVSTQNIWAGKEDRVLLQNKFAQIGVSTYCGTTNIWLRHRADDYDTYYVEDLRTSCLCKNWCNLIHNKFMKEFAEYDEVGRMSDGTGVYKKVS